MKILFKYWDRLIRTLQSSHLWKFLLYKRLSGIILAYLFIEKSNGVVNGYHLLKTELHSYCLLLSLSSLALHGPTPTSERNWWC